MTSHLRIGGVPSRNEPLRRRLVTRIARLVLRVMCLVGLHRMIVGFPDRSPLCLSCGNHVPRSTTNVSR